MPGERKPPRRTPQGDTPRPGDRRQPHAHPPTNPSLLHAAPRLSPRDYTLALLLDEHRALTTDQVTAVLFSSTRTCRNRLHALRGLGFLDRFTHRSAGSDGLTECWVTGPLAARYAALARGDRPPTPAAVRERQDAILASPQLDHLLGTNQFFTDLLAHTRHHPDARLARWWSAAHTAAALGHRIHPDGHGIWRAHHREVGFWLEHDTGTEPLTRLLAKLEPYQRLHAAGGHAYPILFWLPGRTRETNLHRRLPPARVPVATATHRDGNPADAVWQLTGRTDRLRLADLPTDDDGRSGPLHPGPPAEHDDPLRLLTTQASMPTTP